DRSKRNGVGDLIIAYVVDLELAAGRIAQQHVAGKTVHNVIVETAESDKLPIGSNLAQLRAGGDCITPDVVALIETIRTTQDHDGGGADQKSEGLPFAECPRS